MQESTTKHDTALEELAGYHQWVAWEYRKQNTQKAPINPHTRRDASPTDSSNWGTYEEALFTAGGTGQVGFVFSSTDDFCGIDLDHCIIDGEVLPWAVEIVKALDSYTEISPSESGLKIWVRGSKPGENCRTRNVEIYDKDRFFTFTGRQFGSQGKIEERQDELERLYQSLFPKVEDEQINTVVVGSGFSGDDTDLLDKARNANGTGKLFSRLYNLGDTSKYSYDDSRADIALCGMLAYWTGRDAERMDRLFRDSKLYRKKWDERRGSSTYGDNTIALAIKGCKNAYDPNYKADGDIRGMLAGCVELVVSGSWGGRSGPTDRDVYKALIDTGVEYGRVVEDGVIVSASMRDLALRSGIGRRATVADSLKRLEDSRGLICKVEDGGSKRASRYLIRLTRNRTINNRVNKYGTHSSQTQKIRNPGKTYGTIGKRNAHIIDYVRSLGRVVTLEELAKYLGVRNNNLKTRNMNLLVGLELLEEVDGGYLAPADIEDRLQKELKESGQLEAERLQRKKYERERKAWRGEESTTPTVLIQQKGSEVEGPIYYDPEDSCIHGFLHGKGCYLHDPDHPYRKLIEEKERAA